MRRAALRRPPRASTSRRARRTWRATPAAARAPPRPRRACARPRHSPPAALEAVLRDRQTDRQSKVGEREIRVGVGVGVWVREREDGRRAGPAGRRLRLQRAVRGHEAVVHRLFELRTKLRAALVQRRARGGGRECRRAAGLPGGARSPPLGCDRSEQGVNGDAEVQASRMYTQKKESKAGHAEQGKNERRRARATPVG